MTDRRFVFSMSESEDDTPAMMILTMSDDRPIAIALADAMVDGVKRAGGTVVETRIDEERIER